MQASISIDSNFQKAHSKSNTNQWLVDRQLDHLIPVFRRFDIELPMLWRCSEKELYEMFCSTGLSKIETLTLRDRVVLDRHWRGHLFDSNVFDELNTLVDEESKLAKNMLAYKDVKAEIDQACDQYLESCKTAVEQIRNETHEQVEAIRENNEERAKVLQKAKNTIKKLLFCDPRGLARDTALKIEQILEKIRPGSRNREFSIKPIYAYKQPKFAMLRRCLKRKLSRDLDKCERWDEKFNDHEIRLENSGSKAVKINKDRISDVRGAIGHKTGVHTWFMTVDGKEFAGKSGVHFVVLGLQVMWKGQIQKYGWCTRTSAPNLLESCNFIGGENTFALPGETVEITLNIEQKILTFSLPRYGPLPFLTIELSLAGGACIYPWAQLYNESYDNSVAISAYI